NDHKGNNSNGNNGNGNGELTPKQAKFVDEYLIDLNATQAAIRAKYAPKSAESKASQLLSLIKVQKAIQKRRDELSIKAQISQEWVLERYKRLVEYHLDDIYDETGKLKSFDQIPKNALYAIQGFKNLNNKSTSEGKYGSKVSETLLQEIKLPDKRGVLDSLARHLGMFADEGQGGNKFNFNAPVQINVGWEDA
ncbi:MAG: terminase small subunit, partial [Gammaproteobacteria bacterium]|nr:terminase small subunit [Gammaproteobacteria bacterium]